MDQAWCSSGACRIAAVDAPRAVGQLHHRIEGGDRPAVGPDDMDLLRDLAVQGHDLAEVEHARAIDRLVALPDHVHEDLGRAEHAADRGRGVAEGGLAVVAAEGVDLALDGVADGRAVGRPTGPAQERGAARPSISPTRARKEKAVAGLMASIAWCIPKSEGRSCYWKGRNRSKTAIFEPREGLAALLPGPGGGVAPLSRGLHRAGRFH